MNLTWRNLGTISAFLFIAGLTGCAPKEPGETDSASEGSAGDTTATAGDDTGATPTTGGDGHSSTGGGATESAGSATTEPPGTTTEGPDTETAGTETGGGSAIEMACAKACAHIFECDKNLPGTPGDCNMGCVASWGGPECGDVGVAFIDCLTAMSCPELVAYLEKDEPGVCAEEAEAAEAVCVAGTCDMTFGTDGGMMCSIGRDCGDGVQDFECDGTTCTCVEDGVPGEACEDEGVCAMDPDAQAAVAQACCGWDWS